MPSSSSTEVQTKGDIEIIVRLLHKLFIFQDPLIVYIKLNLHTHLPNYPAITSFCQIKTV